MPLAPAVSALLAQAAAAGRPALSAGTPDDARGLLAAGRAALGQGPDLDRIEDLAVQTRAGPLPARLYVPGPAPAGLVLYLHGGGWVLGTIEDYDAFARLLARRSGLAVLLPEYRLAPEHPFPCGLEDAIDCLDWANRRAADLVGPGLDLVVAGDSAGANLATVAAAERIGRVPLARQVLVYPVADCDVDRPSYLDPENAGLITRRDMLWFFDHYAGAGNPADPRVSPLRRASLAGLPPTHVATAEYDVLRDEGEAYAHRLAQAGIATTLTRHAGLPHGFVRLFNLVPEADRAVAEIADAVAGRTAGRRPTSATTSQGEAP
ncbi:MULTISPECIES: alpha/beta hydrolase [Methylobacterium]|uniref:alpha/beta hydrolase n=1 Tax=Methylobacterium TaxID=407 RepID=UPI0013EE0FB3|nr:alpha/beta hydrolase [Methylobacterium sp. DB0501]NGM34106.1 alpha/beta hydrolase [Methylobacterium sp. DB0501]